MYQGVGYFILSSNVTVEDETFFVSDFSAFNFVHDYMYAVRII